MTTRITPSSEPISGLCFDDLHNLCEWPSDPAYGLWCSCPCHERKARAMTTAEHELPEVDETEPAAARAQELEAESGPGEYVTVPLAGYDGVTKNVRVLPASRWRASAMRALTGGDMDGFMELVLHEDDYGTYEDLDPDMDAIGHFAEAVARAGGESLGKSSGPRRSSRSSRRR
jgi:hypothetical protein